MTNQPDRAAIAIIGLVGVLIVALGFLVVTFGYASAAGAVEGIKLLRSSTSTAPPVGLFELWRPTALSGAATILFGVAFVLGRRWIVATCVIGRLAGAPTWDDRVLISTVVAVGLLLFAASTAAMVTIVVSNAIDGPGGSIENLVFCAVVLMIGSVLVIRPTWIVRLANSGKS